MGLRLGLVLAVLVVGRRRRVRLGRWRMVVRVWG